MTQNKSNRGYMKIPAYNTYVETVRNAKGTKYYCVTVADKYSFYFNTKKRLVEIVDASKGTWDSFTTKAERDWWLSLRGSMDVYRQKVLPSLQEYLKATHTH